MLFWLCMTAWGQVNAEALAEKVVDEGVGVDVRLGGAVQSGNVGLLDVRGGVSGQYRRDFPADVRGPHVLRERVIVALRATYLAVDGRPFLDNRLVHLRYTRMASAVVGVDLFAQYQNNLLVLLDARWTAGASFGIQAVSAQRQQLRLGVGPMVEHEIRNVDPEGPDAKRVTNLRGVGFVDWRWAWIPDRLMLLQTAYVEPRVDGPADVLLLSYSELRAPVSAGGSLGITLNVRHDSRPPVGVEQTDVTLGWRVQATFAKGSDPHEPH